ncbi:MAG: butyrate kinase [Clostridiaceae bacterium]|nr:butyrate kinase [Clostridiaceae bacterium]
MSLILVLNPGSTSTKIAVYQGEKPIFTRSIRHEKESSRQPTVIDQLGFRLLLVKEVLAEANIALADLDAIIGRGGLLHPMEGGTYNVSQDMIDDMARCRYGEHASNLGAIMAAELAKGLPISVFIADPVVVDEMVPEAKYTGWPDFDRIAISHPLNQRAVAKRFARTQDRDYEEMNLIVAHLGGGTSVGAHHQGRIIDVNNALDGDGPFSAERTGGLPLRSVLDFCYSGKHNREGAQRLFIGQGGLYAYLGTKDGIEIEKRIEAGDESATMVIRAMAYQTSKEISSLGAVFLGDVDAILLTGGLAYMKPLVDGIRERVEYLAPVHVFPGEDEMGALALAAEEVLSGEKEAKEYTAY